MKGDRPGKVTVAVAAEPVQLRAKNTAHKKSNSETIKAAVNYTRNEGQAMLINRQMQYLAQPVQPSGASDFAGLKEIERP
jgi:hypothetical protein